MQLKALRNLLLLSALWGGSFLFIRVAAPVLGPIALVDLRVLIAGLALLVYTIMTRSKLDLKTRWRHYLIIGIINDAIPFICISTAELHLTAGLAAILNATSPLFGAVIAALWIKEPLTLKKIIGLLLGIIGVAIVVGWSPLPFSLSLLLSIGASLLAASFYGIGSVYTRVYAKGFGPVSLATCSQLGAGLILIPFTALAPATQTPSWSVLLAVIALALFCTSLGYLLYFWLIENIGPTKALTVTFLVPIFGLLWGYLFLKEPIAVSAFLGFGVILLGTSLVAGLKLPVLRR